MITVGICDDEKQQRTMLRRIAEPYFQLLGQDYAIEEFENGESLLLKLEQEPYGIDIYSASFGRLCWLRKMGSLISMVSLGRCESSFPAVLFVSTRAM